MDEKKLALRKEQGKRLKISREYAGLTQAEFGDKLGHKWSQIKDRELGTVEIKLHFALAVEKIYQINSKWLLAGDGEMVVASEKEPIAEQQSPYYGTSSETHTPEELLIRKTIRILSHDSVFKKALDNNIEAFHEGLLMREELQATRAILTQLKREHDEMKDQMKSLQERLGSVEDKESSG